MKFSKLNKTSRAKYTMLTTNLHKSNPLNATDGFSLNTDRQMNDNVTISGKAMPMLVPPKSFKASQMLSQAMFEEK